MQEIFLLRHAESTANTGEHLPYLHGDHQLSLSDKGFAQAKGLADVLDVYFLRSALIYCSPLLRARLTLAVALTHLGMDDETVRENVLLREQDRGYTSGDTQMALRRTHGWFWYRHAGGESPADVYQRMCLFLDSFYRESQRSGRDNAFIVCHGMTIRCFVMRFLNLSVEDFERMANPLNCDLVRVARSSVVRDAVFDNGQWAVEGIRLRE